MISKSISSSENNKEEIRRETHPSQFSILYIDLPYGNEINSGNKTN